MNLKKTTEEEQQKRRMSQIRRKEGNSSCEKKKTTTQKISQWWHFQTHCCMTFHSVCENKLWRRRLKPLFLFFLLLLNNSKTKVNPLTSSNTPPSLIIYKIWISTSQYCSITSPSVINHLHIRVCVTTREFKLILSTFMRSTTVFACWNTGSGKNYFKLELSSFNQTSSTTNDFYRFIIMVD